MANSWQFIQFILNIFSNKEFDKSTLCKFVSQLEAAVIVYSEPIESVHVKINFP